MLICPLGKAMPLVPLLLFFTSYPSAGRVFDINTERLAAYFRGTGGLSAARQDAFALARGSSTHISEKESKYNYSGELGMYLRLFPSVGIKMGVEVLKSENLSDIMGRTAAGDDLYTLNSESFLFVPQGHLEWAYKSTATMRFFIYIGSGVVDATIENDFQMTALGESTYAPTYTEKLSGTGVATFGGFGLEALLADTTTVSIDIGYRLLKLNKFKHKGEITTIQGEFTKGSIAINDNLTRRQIDLSGFYLGLSFRFYVGIM